MTRAFSRFYRVLGSRGLPPVILAIFLLIYIWMAFISDEPLLMLMEATRTNIVLAALLGLIPVGCLVRLGNQSVRHFRRRTLLRNPGARPAEPGEFSEVVTLCAVLETSTIEKKLASAGYAVRVGEQALSAWKGASIFPSRLLYLLGCASLFAGIILSLTTRSTIQQALVEGEPVIFPGGGGARVDQIRVKDQKGLLLQKKLAVDLVTNSGKKITSGLYPPTSLEGRFLYYRFLGVAPLIRFQAPDVPGGFETYYTLMIYPPGREDTAEVPGTPYRIRFNIPPRPGEDPFLAGTFSLNFKVLKDDVSVLSGTVPIGGSSSAGGYAVSVPGYRKFVATDLVKDHGVFLVWTGMGLFALGFLHGLPAIIFFPRHEMYFNSSAESIMAASHLERDARSRSSHFTDALDSLAVTSEASNIPSQNK